MDEDTAAIGFRARAIRKRRGLSLQAAAGLAGISKGQLSKLENGRKDFTRRGLVEDLAYALGCSPVDITGHPVLITDRRSMAAASAVPAVTAAVHDTMLDDVPDMPVRPLAQLVQLADEANLAADHVRYEVISGSKLGDLISELHVWAATSTGLQRQTALESLVTGCIVARSLAHTLGLGELAVAATTLGWHVAQRTGRLDLACLMAMGRAISYNRIGARRRASAILQTALEAAQAAPGPVGEDTSVAEARGMLHLTSAHIAARDGDVGQVELHVGEARELASYTGERNFLRYHFGPTNVAAWALAAAVETERGPDAAERFAPVIDLGFFDSADRVAAVHFDLARAYAQAEGARDAEVVRHLDVADRRAPIRMRKDPIARDLVEGLGRRDRARSWELNSLKNRYGVA